MIFIKNGVKIKQVIFNIIEHDSNLVTELPNKTD